MENIIALYQKCIKELLSQYTRLNTPETKIVLNFDDERKTYLVMRVGWFERYKRIHRCLVHIEICGDIVVIQANNTEDPLDSDPIALGIPKDKIRLGFIPSDFLAYAEQNPSSGQNTDFESPPRTLSTFQKSSSETYLPSSGY